MAKNNDVATETAVMDEREIKALSVEEIGTLTIYQLLGLDGRHDLLTAEQSATVAAMLKKHLSAEVKKINKVVRAKNKGENVAEWESYLAGAVEILVADYEDIMNRRLAYISVRVTRNEANELDVKSNVRSKRFSEGQVKYGELYRQDGSDSEGAEE